MLRISSAIAILLLACTSAFSQHKYLLKTPNQIRLEMILNPDITIMEDDDLHIHAVDGKMLTNLIFYFEKNVCNVFVTTYQVEEQYSRIVEKMNSEFTKIGPLTWLSFINKGGYDSIIVAKKKGYIYVKEEFVPYE